jgi:predicted DNA-binding transcriptional regulator YafY
MIEDQLIEAIRSRRLVQFHYDGETRQVEPHALGQDQSGDLILSARQISGEAPGWRSFRLAKISALALSDRHFASARQGYNRAHPGLARVTCAT